MKTCPICQGEVVGKITKVFCSESCRSTNRYRTHREMFLLRGRRQYWKDIEKTKIKSREKYQRLKVKRLAYSKIWKARNRDKCRLYNIKAKHRRRALIAEVEIADRHVIAAWWKCVKSKSTAVCYWCRGLVSTKKIQCDHIIPIARGGPHDASNLCVACADCNHSKHTKGLVEWNKKLKEPTLL